MDPHCLCYQKKQNKMKKIKNTFFLSILKLYDSLSFPPSLLPELVNNIKKIKTKKPKIIKPNKKKTQKKQQNKKAKQK